MELWDILDENGIPTGKTVERGRMLSDSEFHLVVHIWISNTKGLLLISKRAECKPYGGMWETTGGSAITGETSLDAAIRETKEEIGIELESTDFHFFTRLKRMSPASPDFVDVWFCRQDAELSILRPDPEEVSSVKWATKNEVIQMIEEGIFLNVFPYLAELFQQI